MGESGGELGNWIQAMGKEKGRGDAINRRKRHRRGKEYLGQNISF